MTITITGAAGFIGSHLSKKLEDTDKLILVDDFSRGKKNYLNHLDVKTICHSGDLRDYNTALTFTKNVDTVYHTAFRIGGVQYLHGSIEKELTALQDNLLIDANIFKACKKNKVKKIIYTSSVSVYNTSAQKSPKAIFKEKSFYKYPLEPEGGYGWAKYIGEKQLRWSSQLGIKTGILRIFKSYGECDDYSEKSGLVVCSLMRKAINYPNEPFIVWGDGSITRCLLYIDDLTDAILKVSKLLDTNTETNNLIYNVGGNKPISIKELAEKIVNLSGKQIPITYKLSNTNEPKSRIPDLTLIKKDTKWKPKTSLDDGLKKTFDWIKEVMK